MLEPTAEPAVAGVPSLAHTHLVRGGSLMLEPTVAGVPESCAYPPRQRWVVDAGAYSEMTAVCARVGCNITDPPLTRWVCAGSSVFGPRVISL